MTRQRLLALMASAVAALVLAGCGDVRAADPAAAPAQAAPTAPVAAPARGVPSDAPVKDTGVASGAKPADGKPSPLHFEPTEKTRADFEVSFPTDI